MSHKINSNKNKSLYFDTTFDSTSYLSCLKDAAKTTTTMNVVQAPPIDTITFEKFDFTLDLAMALVEFMLMKKKVKTLCIQKCRGPSEAFIAIFMALDTVNKLIVSDCSLKFDALFTLATTIETNSLQHLELINNSLYQEEMDIFATTLQSLDATIQLKTLSFENCKFFGHEAITSLANGLQGNGKLFDNNNNKNNNTLSSSLTVLNLTGCYLSDKFIGEIVMSLKNHTTIQELLIAKNCAHVASFVGQPSSPDKQKALGVLLKSTKSLTTLDWSEQRLDVGRSLDIESLGLKYNKTLKVLKLSKNKLSSEVKDIITILSKNNGGGGNTTIEEVDLSYNAITTSHLQSIIAIASTLHGGLKIINLTGNTKCAPEMIKKFSNVAPKSLQVIS